MNAVIDAMWAQIEPHVFITRAAWERDLEGWTIEPVTIDGHLAFAWATRGPEFHFASFNTGAPITLRMIRTRLAPLLERHGFAVTRTPKDGADRQHRFNLAFGFKVTGEDEYFIHYRLEQRCPS